MTQATGNNLLWRCTNTTENYNWVKLLSDAFTAVGFVKHTDTGQVDLTGPTLPLIATALSTTYQEFGYEIRKLVSAGKPTLYCRVGYGNRTAGNGTAPANYCPVMRLLWGSGTDGAGGITGPVPTQGGMATGRGCYPSSEVLPNNVRQWYVASDGQNYLTILLDPTLMVSASRANAEPIMAYGMERTCNPDTGAYDSTGFTQWNMMTSAQAVGTGVSPNFNVHPFSYAITNLTSGLSYVSTFSYPQASGFWSSSGVAATTALFPLTTLMPDVKAPASMVLFGYSNDLSPGLQFSTTVFGVPKTYVPVYPGLYSESTAFHGFGVNLRLCVRVD